MDREGYLQQAIEIIKRFDAIAPYEKYSGGNETEFSFLMDDIRSKNNSYVSANNSFDNNEKELYAQQLVQQSNEMIDMEDARLFVKILLLFSKHEKNEVLDIFDAMVEAAIISKYGAIPSIPIVSFFMGVLNANGIISQVELDTMSKEFVDKIINNSFSNQ